MQITIDTEALSEQDVQILNLLLGYGEAEEPTPEEPAPKATKAKAKPAPEPEEDLLGGGDEAPTVDDALARASEFISAGTPERVKAALALSGTKRVGELSPEDIPAFLESLTD